MASTTVYVVRYRLTTEREWEKFGEKSFNAFYLLLDGVASTFENGAMLAHAHFLSDATEDKAIKWTHNHGEMYGVVKDGNYVTEYLVEARRVITVQEAAATLAYQRKSLADRNAS